jgi:hypothetical protein
MAPVKIRREPISSDPAAEVPREQWGELLVARREFCEQELAHDCRLLLFFIQDGAANDWLGLGGWDQYIQDGLKLQPEMVGWALEGLKATRPDVAVKFKDAVDYGKHGGQIPHSKPEGSRITRSLGTSDTVARVRARLKRDGKADLLAQVERGEISAHEAAIKADYRHATIQHQPTVAGFARAAQKHLSAAERQQLVEALK